MITSSLVNSASLLSSRSMLSGRRIIWILRHCSMTLFLVTIITSGYFIQIWSAYSAVSHIFIIVVTCFTILARSWFNYLFYKYVRLWNKTSSKERELKNGFLPMCGMVRYLRSSRGIKLEMLVKKLPSILFYCLHLSLCSLFRLWVVRDCFIWDTINTV